MKRLRTDNIILKLSLLYFSFKFAVHMYRYSTDMQTLKKHNHSQRIPLVLNIRLES